MEQGRRGKGRPLGEGSSVWGAGESSWPGEGESAKLVIVMGAGESSWASFYISVI